MAPHLPRHPAQPPCLGPQHSLPARSQDMQPAARPSLRHQMLPSARSSLQPQSAPSPRDRAQPAREPPPPHQPDLQLPGPRRVPRLRAVVESPAFRNILVDEMDMMHARAATLIQANWRGHQLRRKLLSQMSTAKAIQEAWRRFSTRHLHRPSQPGLRKGRAEDRDIPYHPPQQVRFQPPGTPAQPLVVSRETQCPSSSNLAPCDPPLAPPRATAAQGAPQPASYVTGAPEVSLPPPQPMTAGLPSPGGLDSKCQSALLMTTVTASCLVRRTEGDALKARPVTARANRMGTPEPTVARTYSQAVPGPHRIQTHTETETFKAQPQTRMVPAVTKPPAQTGPAAPTVLGTQPEPCLAPTTPKAQAQMQPTPSQTSATHPVATVAQYPPQGHPAGAVTKPLPPLGTMPTLTKALPQTRRVTTTKSMLQMRPAVPDSRTLSLSSRGASVARPLSRTRLVAMITKTPAQIRSVAAILRTLRLSPPGAVGHRAPPPAAGPDASRACLNGPKAKVAPTGKEAAMQTGKAASHACWTEGTHMGVSQCRPEAEVPKVPTKGPLEAEKNNTCLQKQEKKEMGSETSMAMQTTRTSWWTRVTSHRDPGLPQSSQKMDVIKVQSQVLTVVEAAVSLPPAQMASLARVPSEPSLATAPSQPAKGTVLPTCQPAALSQPQPTTQLATSPHVHPKQIKALAQPRLAMCPTRGVPTAPPAAKLSSRALSQMPLAGPKGPASSHWHSGTLGPPSQAKPDDRWSQPRAHSPGQAARPTTRDSQGALVPLLPAASNAATPASCHADPWGDRETVQAQLPLPSQVEPSLEDAAACHLASLCAELAAVLGSQEDLRALLARVLSQGEVRAALSQALSKEVLGTTAAKALPHSLLGTALGKALSWGELGIMLSRTLCRGELRAEVTKTLQGKVLEVLSRTLSEEECTALSRALCQGELGALLGPSRSQAALTTAAFLPKATSKASRSGTTLLPGPVQGPSLGHARLQFSKVRVSHRGSWGDFAVLTEWGDGAVLGGSPYSSHSPVDAPVGGRVIPRVLRHPPVVHSGAPLLSCYVGSLSSSCCQYLSSEGRKGAAWPSPGAGDSAPDLGPMAGCQAPRPLEPPLGPWQPFTAVGLGPSTQRPPVVTCGLAPSTHQTHAASRVAPRQRASAGEGRVTSGRVLGRTGVGRAAGSPWAPTAGRGTTCRCQSVGASRVSPNPYGRTIARGQRQPAKATTQEDLRKTQLLNPRQASLTSCKVPTGPPEPVIKISHQTPAGRLQMPLPQELATSHPVALTNKLVVSVPCCPEDPLPKSTSTSSSLDISSSPSSPSTRSSHSLSTTSTGSLAAIRVLDESSEGDDHTDLPVAPCRPREAVRQAWSLEDLDPMPEAQRATPTPCPAIPGFKSVLCGTSVLSHLALSIHWDREAGRSCMDTTKKLAQGTSASSPRRTLSLGTLALTTEQQPSAAHALSQPSVATRGTPHLGQSSGDVRESPTFRQPFLATELTWSLSPAPLCSQVSPGLTYPSPARGVAPDEAQPPAIQTVPSSHAQTFVTAGVSQSASQPAVTTRLAPSSAQSTMCPRMATGLAKLYAPGRVGPGPTHTFMAGEMAPSPTQESWASGKGPLQAQPSETREMAPDLAQPSVASRVTLSLIQSLMASGGSPSLAQPSVASEVAPSLEELSMASGVSPSIHHQPVSTELSPTFDQPAVARGPFPALDQPLVASHRSPRLAHCCVARDTSLSLAYSARAPILSQPCGLSDMAATLPRCSAVSEVTPSMAHLPATCGVSPHLGQPSETSRVVPRDRQTLPSSRVTSRLAQPFVATGMSPSGSQPSMDSLRSLSLAHPPVAPRPASSLSQLAGGHEVGPGLSQPVSKGPLALQSYPSTPGSARAGTAHLAGGQGAGPAGLDQLPGGNAVLGGVLHPQDPELKELFLGFHQPGKMYGWPPSPATASVPSPHQAPVAHREGRGPIHKSGGSHHIRFKGVASRASLERMAADRLLLLSQGDMEASVGQSQCQVTDGMAAMVPPALGTGGPLMHQEVWMMGLDQNPGPAAVSHRPEVNQSQPSLHSLAPGSFRASVPQCLHPSGAILVPARYQDPGVDPQNPEVGTASSGFAQGSFDTVSVDLDLSLPSRSVTRGVGQSLPPGSMMDGMAHSFPPEFMINGIVHILPPGSGFMIDGVAHSLPPGFLVDWNAQRSSSGSMMYGRVQNHTPGLMVDGKAQSFPPGSMMYGSVQSHPPGFMMDDKAQSLPPGFYINGTAHSYLPGAMINSMVQSHPSGATFKDVAKWLPPEPMTCNMAQSLPLAPVACGVAQRPSPGSVTSGVALSQVTTGSLSRTKPRLSVGPLATFRAPRPSPGPDVPLCSRTSTGRSLPRGSLLVGISPRPYNRAWPARVSATPSKTSRASSLTHVHPRASARSRRQVLSRVSLLGQDPGRVTSGATGDPTMSKLRESCKSLPRASRSSKSTRSEVLKATLRTCDCPPGTDGDPAPRSLAAQGAPLEHQGSSWEAAPGHACVPPTPLQAPSSASSSTPIPQPKPLSQWEPLSSCHIAASHVPLRYSRATSQRLAPEAAQGSSNLQPTSRGHAQGTATSNMISGSPLLANGTASSTASMGSTKCPQRVGTTSIISNTQPPRSGTRTAAPDLPKMEAASMILQKPAPKPVAQNSLDRCPGARECHKSMHRSLITELLEGSRAKLAPSHQAQAQRPQATPGNAEPAARTTGTVSVLHSSHTVCGPSALGLAQEILRVSSLSESWRCLLDQSSDRYWGPKASYHEPPMTSRVPQSQVPHNFTGPILSHCKPPATPMIPQSQIPCNVMVPQAVPHKPSMIPNVPQGPVDTSTPGGQLWNPAVPRAATFRPLDHAAAPPSVWAATRVPKLWDSAGHEPALATDRGRPGDLPSVLAMEKMVSHAVTVIQACARGYMVRRTIKVWHQWATVIQAMWRGYRVRRNLAQLNKATTVIQAVWRGYRTRKDRIRQKLLPVTWAELSGWTGTATRCHPTPGGEVGTTAAPWHRCFQSCQPQFCSLCQFLRPGLGSPPSVVMLVGSSARTCHMCGHTLPTRVVHGMGRGTPGWACAPKTCPSQQSSKCFQKSPNEAATAIQSAWRGFKVRHQLQQQHTAARAVQATWRGHYTRSCLTPDALLGTGGPGLSTQGAAQLSSQPPSRGPGSKIGY